MHHLPAQGARQLRRQRVLQRCLHVHEALAGGGRVRQPGRVRKRRFQRVQRLQYNASRI